MLSTAFTMLFSKLASIISWISSLAVAVFTAGWDLLCDAATWPFEQVCDMAISALNAVDLSGIQQYTNAWGDLPGEIVNVLGLLGVGEAGAIIAAAIAVRLILQLIPFTRLGS